jgi:hypothetical protein
MFNRRIAIALILACLPLTSIAQESVDMGELNSAIETQRQVSEAQRQMIVSQNLELTEAESSAFWPLYRQYRADVAKLVDRKVSVITRYAKNYESLDDDTALSLLRESVKVEVDKVKLTQRYISRFNKVIPGTKVTRYMQVEFRLDTIANLKLQSSIPLVM